MKAIVCVVAGMVLVAYNPDLGDMILEMIDNAIRSIGNI